MKKNFILTICLSILLLSGVIFAKSRALDLNNFVGIWNIYDSNNTLIDTVDITLAINHGGLTRFSYQQESHQNSEKTSLRGLMINNLIVFDLIKLGYAKTYVAKINNLTTGGGGIEISSQLASCNVVGKDGSQVARKFLARLASRSARCDGSSFYNHEQRNIKFVKNGISPTTITTGGSPSSAIGNNLETTKKRLLGIWDFKTQNQKLQRLVNKNIEANFLGYQFIYKLINPAVNLLELKQSDFQSGSRLALLIDNYLIFNPTPFDSENQLLVLKMNLKSGLGSGKQYRTFNGDCVPPRSPANSVKVCTPSDQSARKPINTSQIGSVRIKKANTKVSVNF
jgi:hypothetical protein